MPICMVRALELRSSIAGAHAARLSLRIGQSRKSLYSTTDHLAGSSRHETLTLLHKTTSLLPRALESPGLHELWKSLFEDAYIELSSSDRLTKPRIAIYGANEESGAEELVSALLEDPFSQQDILKERWKGKKSRVLSIEYGSLPTVNEDGIFIPSPWLQRFPVLLQEISRASGLSETQRTLYTSDITIVVGSPLTSTVSSLGSFLPNSPHAILILNTSPSQALVASLLHPGLRVLCIDPVRALSALTEIEGNPSSTSTVQKYQDDWAASGISVLPDVLDSILAIPTQILRIHTAQSIIRGGLAACTASITSASDDLSIARDRISALRCLVLEQSVRLKNEVLDGDAVPTALRNAEKDLRVRMDQRTWWKLPFIVDDLSTVVTRELAQTWCKDLQKDLIFQTGLLSASQASLSSSTQTVLHQLPSALQSPLLQNTLAQLTAAPTYLLTPATLTTPIQKRLHQLSFPATRLHLAAQNALLLFSTTSAFSSVAVWTAWAGWLGGWAQVQGTTAASAGALGALFGLRWAIGKWEKGKQRWLEDWRRVGEGLERDLKATLDETMRSKVVVVPETACARLEEIISEKESVVEELKEELEGLHAELQGIEGKMQ